MIVYLRDASAQTVVCAATLRWKLQIKLSVSPHHSILTPGKPVSALILYRQATGRAAPEIPVKLLVRFNLSKKKKKKKKNPRQKRESNLGLPLSRRTPYHQLTGRTVGEVSKFGKRV